MAGRGRANALGEIEGAMTDEQLAEIEERANAATPGPWTVVPQTDKYLVESYDRSTVGRISDAKGETVFGYWADPTGSSLYVLAEDAEFIAHAREDIPTLIAEVREMRDALRSIRTRFLESAGDAFPAEKRAPSLSWAMYSDAIKVLGEKP